MGESSTVHFFGKNAGYFYSLIQNDYTLFSPTKLSQFDIYYSRKNTPNDSITAQDFIVEVLRDIQKTKLNHDIRRNRLGNILHIGHRRSNNVIRVYEEKDLKTYRILV